MGAGPQGCHPWMGVARIPCVNGGPPPRLKHFGPAVLAMPTNYERVHGCMPCQPSAQG